MEVPFDLQVQYLQRRRQDLENCIRSLELENFSELEKVGHRLKGNASTFGFNDLSVIASELEEAAHTRDSQTLEKTLDEFSSWLNRQLN